LINEREKARIYANEIIKSIINSLKKDSQDVNRADDNVLARIPIVNEEMCSVMSTSGNLSERDLKILKQIEEFVSSFKKKNISLEIKQKIKMRRFVTFSGRDWSDLGPCRYYYLEVKKILG